MRDYEMGVLNMFATVIDLLGRPRGLFAPALLTMMNAGHKPFIEAVLSQVPISVNDTVLDVGCGGGNAIALMAPQAGTVYGVDISDASVKKATSKNARFVEAGRVVIRQSDVAALPFEDEIFDLITAFETVYFWKDIEADFALIARKLKPGGTFVVACETTKSGRDGTNKFEAASKGKMKVYCQDEMFSLLTGAGLSSLVKLCPEKQEWLCVSAMRK